MSELTYRMCQTATDLKTRSEQDGEMIIEGYFAVFNKATELWPGAYEKIDPEAFNNTLGNDIRALINHDTTLVLGRNKANTLSLSIDSYGLFGVIQINSEDRDAVNLYERVKRGDVDQCSFGRNKANTLSLSIDSYGLFGVIQINSEDRDAVNLYERVKRGDVDQCSFGFNILNEEIDYRDDGTIEWTLKEIDLHEVSVCTFPAYADTAVQARHNEVEQHKKRMFEQKKMKARDKLNGIKTTDDSEKN